MTLNIESGNINEQDLGYIFPSKIELAAIREVMPAWAIEVNDRETNLALNSLISALTPKI